MISYAVFCLKKKIHQVSIKNIITKNIPNTNVLITSTPPIETPDMSVYMQTLNNHTPKSEYSRRSSIGLKPLKRNFQSSFDNEIIPEKYSFADSRFEEGSSKDNGRSFKIHGTSDIKDDNEIFKSLQNQSIPSFNAISKNDLMLITEENVEILNYLSQNHPSGPYYFNDINLSLIHI